MLLVWPQYKTTSFDVCVQEYAWKTWIAVVVTVPLPWRRHCSRLSLRSHKRVEEMFLAAVRKLQPVSVKQPVKCPLLQVLRVISAALIDKQLMMAADLHLSLQLPTVNRLVQTDTNIFVHHNHYRRHKIWAQCCPLTTLCIFTHQILTRTEDIPTQIELSITEPTRLIVPTVVCNTSCVKCPGNVFASVSVHYY